MDESRIYDIKKLYKVIDSKKPDEVKKLAYKTLRSIRRQINDPILKDLRPKYIKAIQNKDTFHSKILELRIQAREQELGILKEKVVYN